LSNFSFLEQAILTFSNEHHNPAFFEEAIAGLKAEEKNFELFSGDIRNFSIFMEEKTGEGLTDISVLPATYAFSPGGKFIFDFIMPISFSYAATDYSFDYHVYLMKESIRRFEHEVFISLETPFGVYWVSSIDKTTGQLDDLKRKAYPFLAIGTNPALVSDLENVHKDVLDYIGEYLKNFGLHSEYTPAFAQIEDMVYDEKKDIIYFQHEFKAHTETQLKFKNKKPHPHYNEAELIIPYPGFKFIDKELAIVPVPFDLDISYIRQSSMDLRFYALLFYLSQPNTAKLVQSKALGALPENQLLPSA
jgi:hypothetical protein